MDLNNLLRVKDMNPQHVLVLRHTPKEPMLRRKLPQLAAEKPAVFNAYQQTQGPEVEKAMQRAKYVASFIGHEAGRALFVGIYAVGQAQPFTREQYWNVPALLELGNKYGMKGFCPEEENRSSILWFDLSLTEHYAPWKGKLIIKWPPPEIRWFRWSDRNEMLILAILRESELEETIPNWKKLDLTWQELSDLPRSWEDALRQWRAIYYIFDKTDGKGYVGSAYGDENLLGRWRNYAKSGHGTNTLLLDRDPQNFLFTILERVSPDLDGDDVIRLESTWKDRLHTRAPSGLNGNS